MVEEKQGSVVNGRQARLDVIPEGTQGGEAHVYVIWGRTGNKYHAREFPLTPPIHVSPYAPKITQEQWDQKLYAEFERLDAWVQAGCTGEP